MYTKMFWKYKVPDFFNFKKISNRRTEEGWKEERKEGRKDESRNRITTQIINLNYPNIHIILRTLCCKSS